MHIPTTKSVKKFLCISFSFFLPLLFPLAFAHAETHIPEWYFNVNDGDMEWTQANSPYILESSLSIPWRRKLTIREGVDVMNASSSDPNNPYDIWGQGELSILGTKDKPVRILGLGDTIVHGVSRIEHAIFENTGLYISYASSTIDSVKISGANIAIEAKKSRVSIENSEIINNGTGIMSDLWSPGPVLMYNYGNEDNGIGGIGNAFGDDPNQNHITVHNTVFEGNQGYTIRNKNINVIDATDNWWGSADGPGTSVTGAVVADPWKAVDPRAVPAKPKCCSNVLFLPGFEASRLYHQELNLLGTGLPGTMTRHELWEPFSNSDVQKLSLNAQGSSTDTTIYTSDIIDKALGVQGIYAKFIAMMDGMVADKTVNAWLPFAYDWRNTVSDVVLGSTAYATTTKQLISEIEKLALSSQTGKVTIVAHSNGGLVAKMLGQELEKRGESELIDKVIFVAVPQLGTPQAVAGLLHGDDQSLGGGLILSGGTARTFGLNVPGAYGLLPSQDFFSRFTDPIITLAGKAVGSYQGFLDFLTGTSDHRLQPTASDMKSPAVLNQNLITKGEWMHTALDTWNFPAGTDVLSIVGWGRQTAKTISYSSTTPSIIKDAEGDGTVLSKSAASYTAPTIFFNEGLYNHAENQDLKHSTIMESDPLRSTIASAIKTPKPTTLLANALPPYMSSTKPRIEDYPWMASSITISVHSPVDMDIYDSHGHHMGIMPLPGHPESDIKWLDNTIGGDYYSIGDEKYMTVPGDDTYTVGLKGTGTGTFTLEVQKLDANLNEVASTTYTDLPVTPLLVASTTVNIMTTTMATPLSLDVDGNGTVDIKVATSTVMNPLIYLDSMKTIILSLKLKPAQEKIFLKKIEHIRTLLEKGKNDKAIKKIKTMLQKTEDKHINPKKMTEADKQTITDMFTSLLDALDTQ